MSVSFRVNLGNVQARLYNTNNNNSVNNEFNLVVNFANFKQFTAKKPLSIRNETKNNVSSTILDWEFNRPFMYETRNAAFLSQKYLSIQLSSSSELIAEKKLDLYTLCCGPENYELQIDDQVCILLYWIL
jgi:hypothetical protein